MMHQFYQQIRDIITSDKTHKIESMRNVPLSKNQRNYERRSTTVAKPMPLTDPKLRFYVGEGNNSSLVRRVMSTRKNWEEVTDSKYLFLNLRWQQTSKSYNYDNCVDTKVFRHSLNHLEFHQQLSNKQNLFKNLCDYCEANKINVFDTVPITFCLNLADSNFDAHQNQFLKFYDQHLPEKFRNQPRKQWLNLPKRKFGSSTGIDRRGSYHYSKPQILPVYFSQEEAEYLWILKPAFCNRGNGISLFNSINTLETLMRDSLQPQPMAKSMLQGTSTPEVKKKGYRIRQYTNSHPPNYSFIIQKYLEKPLLIEGRKFDVRVWVLFTHEMKVYLFRQGYIRTSSSTYSTKASTLEDLKVHLTNNAVQKNMADYGKFEQGNQLSFKYLQSLVESKGASYDKLVQEMKKVVKLTALSVKKKINKVNRQWCFEIYGYDFMIDEKMKPWLIEVNTNPCLEESSLILENLLPRMLDDAFKLTIDDIFKASKDGNQTKYVLQNYENEENLWDSIVDLRKGN